MERNQMRQLKVVVLALVFCTQGLLFQAGATPRPAPQSQNVNKLVLEDGTPVKLRLARTISSADETVGNSVDWEVVEEILVGEKIVIPKGSVALGTVTDVQAKRRMARGGKLDVNIDTVRLANGQKAALRAVKTGKGGGHTGAMTGAIVATSLVLWPAAPLFLLMHGKDITIPKGTAITAFVQGDDVLERSRFIKSAQPATPAQPVTLAPQATPAVAQVPPQQTAIHQEPAMQIQSVEPLSLGEVARQNRAQKAQQEQSRQQPQPQQ